MVRLIVLGLLKNKSLSGYEIQQILQTSRTDIWAGILPGSIYHALKMMDKEGLVEINNIEQTGHRIKAIYKITEKGEKEFVHLLQKSLEESSVLLPNTLYSGLSFMQEIPLKDKIYALEKQKKNLEQELELQKQGQAIKEAHIELDDVMKLVFENVYNHYELQISFLQKLIDHLKSKLIE